MAEYNSLKSRKGQLDIQQGVTVANLPSPSTFTGFAVRVVTDATSPAAGSAPVGGGAARALVWYNGTAWRVIGV